MDLRGMIVAAGCWLVAGMAPLQASETGPVIVIPGRPGVPVIMNGQDVSYAVIEGDWGLARPGQNEPRILYRYGNGALIGPSSGNYFPKTAVRRASAARKSIFRARCVRQRSYHRAFGVQSDPTPVTPPQSMPQTPPIIVAPNMRHHP